MRCEGKSVTKRNIERGQVLIILILGFVGLLGFTALAIDGGIIYSERRRAQGAADAASLAAALAKIKSGDWQAAALSRAYDNGFDNNGATNTVEVYNPPVSGPHAGSGSYIQVIITSEVNSAFAHFVFSGPLKNTVEAVSRVHVEQPIAPGYALYATSEHECEAIWFTGGGSMDIYGGGVFSNSGASADNCASGRQGGASSITVHDGFKIEVAGKFRYDPDSGAVNPPPDQFVPQQRLPAVPLPDCSGLPDWGEVIIKDEASGALQPGRYSSISLGSNGVATMDPGLYCVYGSNGIKANGGSLTGAGVVMYMQVGAFDLGGNTVVQLSAETTRGVLVDPSGNDWAGMLLYVDPLNTSDVKIITGTSNSYYEGTIYSPSSACDYRGTGDNLRLTQLICNTVTVTGNATMTLTYDPNLTFKLPARIDLAR